MGTREKYGRRLLTKHRFRLLAPIEQREHHQHLCLTGHPADLLCPTEPSCKPLPAEDLEEGRKMDIPADFFMAQSEIWANQ